MFEVLLTLGGVILGALLTAGYERMMERRAAKHIRLLLSRELATNITDLREVLSIFEMLHGADYPDDMKLSLEEIVERVKSACHSESFEACRTNLPVLGSGTMEAVFSFYDHCQDVPHSFREVYRWRGNIRHGFFEDHIRSLIKDAEKLKATLDEQNNIRPD